MNQKATRGLRAEVFPAISRSREVFTRVSLRDGLGTSNHGITLENLKAMKELSKFLNLEDIKLL